LFVFRIYTGITGKSSFEIDLLVILIMGLIRFRLAVLTPHLAYATIFVSPTKILFGITLFTTARTNLFHQSMELLILKIKKGSPPATFFTFSDTMTVCTPDLTFGNFGFDGRPGEAFTYHPRNITRLLSSHVVELKNTDICATAIHTGMGS